MPIAKIGLFLLVLGASQWLAETIQAAVSPDRISSWFWGLMAQYFICVLLLYIVDGNTLHKSFEGAITITVLVRAYYLFRRTLS